MDSRLRGNDGLAPDLLQRGLHAGETADALAVDEHLRHLAHRGPALGVERQPLRFVVDVNILVGIPIIDQIGTGTRAPKPGFAVHGDLSLGVSLAF